MHISFTLGAWIVPLILTLAIPVVGYIESRTLGDYGIPVFTMLTVVAAVVAWVTWMLTLLLS